MTMPKTEGKEDEVIYLPSFPVLQKPKFGSPCNGCGWCCHEEICFYGKMFFELGDKETFIKGPCPAMVYESGCVKCGLVLSEKALGLEPVLERGLAIGKGCDADDHETYLRNPS